MTFRFIGSELQIGHTVLRTFGQPIELDAEFAKELIAHEHTAPLLPEDRFNALTGDADAKRKQAHSALYELRQDLLMSGGFDKESK